MRKLLRANTYRDVWCRGTARAILSAVVMALWSAVPAVAQTEEDCDLYVAVQCPESAVISCAEYDGGEWVGEVPGWELVDPCGIHQGDFLQLSYDDEVVSNGDCTDVIARTWTVVFGNATGSCTYLVSINDTEGPVFDATPEDITVECGDEIPGPWTISATDACGEVVETEVFVSSNSGGEGLVGSQVVCQLTTPIGPGPDGAIWLNLDNDALMEAFELFAWTGNPTLTSYPDGTAHLVGNVQNLLNPTQGWSVDMWFENKRNWTDWSALGRSYKDDLGFGAANHQNWDYYELVATFSTLTGTGSMAGSILYLSHQPENYYFGFQSGVGANNRNGNEGMSGWFYWTGWYNGEWMNGNGDLFTDKFCQNTETECEEEITYVYRAEDGCGNNSFVSQTITIVDTTAPEFENCPENVTVECSDELPALPEVTAVDACTNVTVVFEGEFGPFVDEENPCVSTILRRWTATDECDNQAICQQVITIVDTTAPVFTYVPADATYECDEEVVYEDATAEDNCHDATVTVSEEISEGDCPQEYTITRYFTATDGCGNYSYAQQVISVVDTTAPVFDEYDNYVAVECTEVDNVPAPTATDNCGEVTIELTDETLSSGGCLGVLIRTYTATDECGNSSEAVIYITILDTTPPVINNPEDFTAECDNVPSLPEIEIYDNCGYDVTVETNVEIVPGECADSYTIVWTWTATDYCENVSTASTNVTIVDTTDPWFEYYPEDETYECDQDVPAAVIPPAFDNCDDDVETEVVETIIPGECPQEYIIERIYRAFDNCGNQAIWAQYIYVQDTTAPWFDEQEDDFTYECSEEVPYIEPGVSDNCGEVTLEYSDESEIESDCYGYTWRTWTATDECGNSSTFTQTFMIQDTTEPVIEGTIEIELPCDDYAGIYVTATDNCDEEVEIDYSDEFVSGGCQGRIIRTYTAYDNCQNWSTFVQIITLTDEVAPVVDGQDADFTVECDQEYAIPTAWFSDNCDEELDVEMTVASGTDGCTTTVTYTYTATDNCDNSVSTSITVTIVDTTDPVVYAPYGGTFECDEEIVYGWAEATDNCDEDLEIAYSDETIAGDCPQSYTIVRTWTATDDCDNVGYGTSYYYVYDWTAPEFTSVPESVTIECSDEIPGGEATAEDNCGAVTVTSSEWTEEGQCANSYTIVREFVAVDECDNANYAYQYIYVQDTTAPVIEGTVEIELPCDDYAGIYVTVSDNCDEEVDIDVISDEFVSGGCQGRIIRTYEAWDNCYNSSTFVQIITLTDEVAPVVEGQDADFTVECDQEYAIPTAWFSDNCDEELDVEMTTASGTDGCTTTVTYTYTATDNCDNSVSASITVTIVDTTEPIVYAPYGGTFECDEEIVYGSAEASDNCDEDLEIAFSDETIAGDCPQSYTIVRTWTATDDCDNVGYGYSYYYVYDWTAPELSVADDVTIECDGEIPTGSYEASDNCGEVTVTWNDESEPNYIPGNCGQYRTQTPGGWGAPANGNNPGVYRDANFDGAFPNGLVVGCDGGFTLTLTSASAVEEFLPAGGNAGALTEDLVDPSDYSNNLASHLVAATLSLTFDAYDADFGDADGYLGDLTYPDGPFAGMSVSEVVAIANAVLGGCSEAYSASDMVDALTILNENFVDGTTNNENLDCQDELLICGEIITRTYTAVDECGNTTTATQTITIIDTTAPVFTGEIEIELPCDDYAGIYVTVSDNCDEEVDVDVMNDELVSGGCQGRIIRTYRAIDDCGNASTFQQIITLTDEVAPVVEEQDADFTVECDQEYAIPMAWFSDNCDDELDVEMTTASGTDGCTTTVTYTYTATDNCDNSVSTSITVTIVDTTDPIVYAPYGGSFECDEEIEYGWAEASDNCDEDLDITFSDETIAGECPQSYMIVRTWVATDDCGNEGSATSTYYVYDWTAPSFDNTPADEYYDCAPEDWTPAAVTASDNCDEVVDVTVEILPDLDECGNGAILVVYTATDDCGNEAQQSYVAYINDDVDPVLSDYPQDMEMECGQELPEAPEITATDNCDTDVEVSFEEWTYGDAPVLEEGELAVCDLITPALPEGDPCNYDAPWAMALFSMPSSYRWYVVDEDYSGNELTQYNDGTIVLHVKLRNRNDATSGFYADVTFANGMPWSEWSTQAFLTGFKADCGGEAENHESWLYYLLQASEGAELVGYGAYEGSSLNLVHAPSNNYFGFQLGDGANNYNGADNGFGGWFTYSGTFLVDGEQIMSGNASGAGDFAFELDCCPDYTVVRCWTAYDCSGNMVQHCQTFTYGDGGEQPSYDLNPYDDVQVVAEKGNLEIVNVFPNPAVDVVQVKFVSNVQDNVTLDIIDATGRKVGSIFNGMVEAGQVYRFDVNTSQFNNGLYQVRLMSLTEVQTKQLQVIR